MDQSVSRVGDDVEKHLLFYRNLWVLSARHCLLCTVNTDSVVVANLRLLNGSRQCLTFGRRPLVFLALLYALGSFPGWGT